MAKTIRHEFDKYLTYDNLMKAHLLSRKEKNCKKEVILFNLKQEEYIRWLYEQLKNGTYKHGGYRVFYIQYPKRRKIEASRYMDGSILFVKIKKEAIELLEKIKNYLKIKLELELNDKTKIFKSNQGVNFCGYKINEYRLKLRDRGKKAIKQKVRYLKEEVQKGNMNSKEASKFICGHLGYMKYANTRNLEEKLFYIN